MVPIVDEPTISPSIDIAESANSVYELPSTKEMVRFLHAALGYPTKATMLTAAKHGNLVTFPGLTPENISRHFPDSVETQKGHMKQTKQGVRSTKVIDEDAMLGFTPNPGVKHKDVYLRTFDATKKQMYSDQTGKFPVALSTVNNYLLLVYDFDSNGILDTAVVGNGVLGFKTPGFTLGNGSAPMTFDMNVAGTTQFGNDSSVSDITQNGYTSGSLVSFTIDETGTVVATYSNDQTKNIDQIQLATFSMGGPQAVIPVSENIAAKCTRDALQFNPNHGAGADVLDALIRQVDRSIVRPEESWRL